MTGREASDMVSNRRCAYLTASLAWLAVLPLVPTWITIATVLAPAPWLARRAFVYGRDRLRIPLLDRQEREA